MNVAQMIKIYEKEYWNNFFDFGTVGISDFSLNELNAKTCINKDLKLRQNIS